MSAENVEIVRKIYEAAARRDSETVLDLYDPEVEFETAGHPFPSLIGGSSVYRGHEGLRRFFRERAEALDDVDDRLDEVVDLEEHVLTVQTVSGRGRASGIEVALTMAAGLWTVRDGKVTRVSWFGSREDAQEAAKSGGPTHQTNLDIARAISEEWERGDFSSSDWADPEIEFVRADGPSPARWKGIADMAAGTRDWISAWDSARLVPIEYRVADDGRVMVLARALGRSKTGGVDLGELQAMVAHVFELHDGKVIRFTQYLDTDHAFAALGLDSTPARVAPADLPRRFVHMERVRWGDLDGWRHLNSVVYQRYFETAFVEFRKQLRIFGDPFGAGGDFFPLVIAEFHIGYRSPVLFDEPLEIELSVGEVRRSSFHIGFEMRVVDRLCADGHGVYVGFDAEKQRAAPLPDEFRAALEQAASFTE